MIVQNLPAFPSLLHYYAENLTPSCHRSWSTGIMERYLPLQYYNHMEFHANKAWKSALTSRFILLNMVFIYIIKSDVCIKLKYT